MNKKELVARLARQAGISPRRALDAVDALFAPNREGLIAGALAEGERVSFRNFGTLATKVRPARRVRLPSGEEVIAPPKTVVVFRPSRRLRDGVEAEEE